MSWTHNAANLNDYRLLIPGAIVAKDGPFWLSFVKSPQLICDIMWMWMALWLHIGWLFLHVQIGGKVIFTSE